MVFPGLFGVVFSLTLIVTYIFLIEITRTLKNLYSFDKVPPLFLSVPLKFLEV